MTRSGGIQETQCLLAEKMILKSPVLAEYRTSLLEVHLDVQPGLVVEHVLKMNQMGKPSYLQPLSDEAVYSLHLLLHHEIDHDLIESA
ncbi:carboxypeptidase, putative [Leishmania tarentolae]|uniref:Carboxypeptidase, putative n=1 Tax=Leishmania tarentolae TaxID=5689 RepID=A0A640KX42_LEITA|nr:carboxypeptidase, putative [Leishmania tarentolae]